MKRMSEIKRIVDLYELHKSYKRVARELKISRKTVRKYVKRVESVKRGIEEEIVPRDRKIQQPCRVLTKEIKEEIHRILEDNPNLPRKQRWTGKKIWDHLTKAGHVISYCP